MSAVPPTGAGAGLDAIRARFALTYDELWVLYIALGGTLGADALAAYLSGSTVVEVLEHNTIVQALNEQALDAGLDHPVAYIERER